MTVEPRSYSVARRAGAAAATVRGALAEAPGLPAQAAALIALLYLAGTEGGYYATDWYPVGLVVIALLAVLGRGASATAPSGPGDRRRGAAGRLRRLGARVDLLGR